jgi:hypothetical protein
MKNLRLALALALGLALGLALWADPAQAHSAFMNCSDNADGSILCEGGFSDGSSASGVPVKVLGADGQEIVAGKMSADDEFVFQKPAGDYKVLLDAGDGHEVAVDGKSIVK